MRATAYNGKHGRVVQLPTWVELRLPTDPDDAPSAACKRCGRSVSFSGPRQEDERALGRFAVWHRRCKDPELVRAAANAAAERRAEQARRQGSLIVWRRKR